VSISAGDAFISSEYEVMAATLDHNNAADVIEGNFSCPNQRRTLPCGRGRSQDSTSWQKSSA